MKPKPVTTTKEAIEFVRKHGIVLVSGKGPVPRLSEAIIGSPIKGSWWAHPRSHEMFQIFRAVADSPEILVCRLVNEKLTLVHRRLWPALVRLARNFCARQLEQAGQEHTTSGYHVSRNVPFPKWVPAEVLKEAKLLKEKDAVDALEPAFPAQKIGSALECPQSKVN